MGSPANPGSTQSLETNRTNCPSLVGFLLGRLKHNNGGSALRLWKAFELPSRLVDSSFGSTIILFLLVLRDCGNGPGPLEENHKVGL